MINIRIDGNIMEAKIKGKPEDILIDLAKAVNGVYNQLYEKEIGMEYDDFIEMLTEILHLAKKNMTTEVLHN